MTPSARLQATLELLCEIATKPRPADGLVSAYFHARRYIGSHDRAVISSRLYQILRHQARLDWWLTQKKTEATPRSRTIVWLVLGERVASKSLESLFGEGPYAAPSLEDAERKMIRSLEGHTIEDPAMEEAVLAECPPALVSSLKMKFGAQFLTELRAMQEPAPLDLRINPLKTTRDAILATLKEKGIKAEAGKLSPWCVRAFERPSLNALAMLKEGLVEIQDEGSQLVSAVVEAAPGNRVVDFCAGAGGKTLALAAMMNNKGRIVACDVSKGRLKRSSERFRRAGVFNVETKVLSSERDVWVKKHKESFDKVLVDAPCSGTGTWRRNPDARWRELGPGLEALTEMQARILENAARLVKSKGRLVYATCSLLPQENENQIDAFLKKHDDFVLTPCGLNGADFLALTPAEHGTDGFFAAALLRR
ncbi:MAG: RsmB/NOP family class I SAM-dependent RNA methyltransferase [Alphaproteobacteria bacterium]|nr:RsmB/NOP family class I SAM-dependent RNA methyltransferase [Alphaproteobacteria bacterium]